MKDGDGNPIKIPLLKYYTVFHINQCDGLTPRFTSHPNGADHVADADTAIDAYLSREHIRIEFGSDSAYYSPT